MRATSFRYSWKYGESKEVSAGGRLSATSNLAEALSCVVFWDCVRFVMILIFCSGDVGASLFLIPILTLLLCNVKRFSIEI